MNLMDVFYAEAIRQIINIIGYEAAYRALMADALDRLDATRRQALSMDGAFASEAAQIMREYPDWDFRFVPSGDGFRLEAKAKGSEKSEAEVVEINRRVQEAFERHKKIPIDSVKLDSSVIREKTLVEDE